MSISGKEFLEKLPPLSDETAAVILEGRGEDTVASTTINILDHGYLKFIESWGSDEAIIRAARMSTDKGFLGWGPTAEDCAKCRGDGWLKPATADMPPEYKCEQCAGSGKKPGDEKLLKYLYDNKHSTPFEMAGLTIEVQAPIFVFREWHRHRVPFGYSELSSRYSPLPDVNYVPSVERLMMRSKGNKQAGAVAGAAELTEELAALYRERLQETYTHQELRYQEALQFGVPKELARVHLPVGRYSRMRATGNLRGWLAFLTLRQAPTAQFEIRQYADALNAILVDCFPRTLALFNEGRS